MQGKLAVKGGIQASTGDSFYRGGSVDFTQGGISYSPLGADQHTTPGTPGTPGTPPSQTVTPGTPDQAGMQNVGDVTFPTQGDTPPPAQVQTAADRIRSIERPGLTVTGVGVIGHTSRAWRHLPPGQTREQANQALSERRGRNVAGALGPLVSPITAHGSGQGDLLAAALGKPETDLSPEDQRASIHADTLQEGTPDQVTDVPGTPGAPGTPGTTTQDEFTIRPSIPNPFTSQRTAWGWDTTVGGGALAGAEGAAGVYGGVGVSYSFPLGKVHLQADTMQAIRSAVGVAKMLGDIVTISPLGFFRDLMGFLTPVAQDAAPAIGSAATGLAMPTPS